MKSRGFAWLLFACLAGSAVASDGQEPRDYRLEHYRSPVPETLQGAVVVDSETAHQLWQAGETAFVDVFPQAPKPTNLPKNTIWRERPRETIPGAIWLPNVGYGALHADKLPVGMRNKWPPEARPVRGQHAPGMCLIAISCP